MIITIIEINNDKDRAIKNDLVNVGTKYHLRFAENCKKLVTLTESYFFRLFRCLDDYSQSHRHEMLENNYAVMGILRPCNSYNNNFILRIL